MTRISNYARPGSAARNAPSTPGSTVAGGGLDSVTDGTVTVTDATSLSFLRRSVYDGGAGVAEVDIDPLVTIASSGAAQTLDVADGGTFDITLDDDCTVSLTGPTLTDNASMAVILRGGDTYDVTWPGSVTWLEGSAPTLSALAVVVLWTVDGGTSWGGTLVGGGAVNLTAADTVSDETTWGISPDAGVSSDYSRGDHTHGSPTEPEGTGGGGTNYQSIHAGFADWVSATGTWGLNLWTDTGQTPLNSFPGYQNSAGAQNDELSIDLWMDAGTYTVTLFGRKSSNTAIVTVNLDGSSQGTVDTYAASPVYYTASVTGITVSSGKRTWQFKAASKNASSSGYYMGFYYIVIRRTA